MSNPSSDLSRPASTPTALAAAAALKQGPMQMYVPAGALSYPTQMNYHAAPFNSQAMPAPMQMQYQQVPMNQMYRTHPAMQQPMMQPAINQPKFAPVQDASMYQPFAQNSGFVPHAGYQQHSGYYVPQGHAQPDSRSYAHRGYVPQQNYQRQSYSRPYEEPNPFESNAASGGNTEQGINFDSYDNIPVEVSGDNVPAPMDEFQLLSLPAALTTNIGLCKYARPTPVQKYAIPIALAGRDLMACAQTGSGKTAAYLIPIVAAMLNNNSSEPASSYDPVTHTRKYAPIGLVLSPTRELATQIYEQSRKFLYKSGLRSVVVYGGVDIKGQMFDMNRGCHLIVATPGRLVDFLTRARMTLAGTRYLVFDEADRMMDMGFEPQIRRIVEQEDMPSGEQRQTLMFSATFPKEIQALALDFLRQYVFLTVGRVGSTTESITQQVELVEETDKAEALLRALQKHDGLTLVFVETKRGADIIEATLRRAGIHAAAIHGDRSQHDRESVLAEFRRGRCRVLVATDVASRGLDIPNVMHVVNYDMPTNIDDYVHRIGRTGRCGNTGIATAFVNEKNRNILRQLFDLMTESNQEVPEWFQNFTFRDKYGRPQSGGWNGHGRGRGRGGAHNFGSRDFRLQSMPGRGGMTQYGFGHQQQQMPFQHMMHHAAAAPNYNARPFVPMAMQPQYAQNPNQYQQNQFQPSAPLSDVNADAQRQI